MIEVEGLTVRLPVEGEMRTVLRDVCLRLNDGGALGLVGESGSGKSMTVRAMARLLPPGAEVEGSITFRGQNVLELRGEALQRYRQEVSVVFQDPRSAINPVRSIGDFMCEQVRTVKKAPRAETERKAIELLAEVGVDDGERRLRQFPHELSGGLLQRVMIASVLLAEPALILADEPTTALDVTTQSDVMAIVNEARHARGLSLLFISHDLDLAASVCDVTAVMYAGQIMESQRSDRLHKHPLHPYTAGLGAARPAVDRDVDRLVAIAGRPVSAFEAPDGCAFAPRCPAVLECCRTSRPPMLERGGGLVRCARVDEITPSMTVVVEEVELSRDA